MSWNYRVIRFKGEPESASDTGEYYEIKEVFYNRDGSLMGYCDAAVGGESFKDLIDTLTMMKSDATKGVIDEEEFFKSAKEKDDD